MTDAALVYDDLEDEAFIDAGAGSGVGRLQKAALETNDISGVLTESELAALGSQVVADWRMDLNANATWREKAERALDAAAQEDPEAKDYPWQGAANTQYPLLTIASIQFNARAYPAIVKGDEVVKVKTFGRDPQGQKQARANRMGEYLNWKLLYGMDGWEADTDQLLLRLPIVGQHFRKTYYDPIERNHVVESVSALRLTIPPDAPSLKEAPRITHDFDRYPYQLQRMMKAGEYRKVTLANTAEDTQASRIILEQHRMMDLDEDGLDEPYVVTVDEATAQVLRIEEAFYEDGVIEEDGEVLRIERWGPFTSYSFIPDPKGRAYGIGFGHLLEPIMAIVNSNINMLLDAGHAQVAGGGFIGSEIRLQGAGQNGVLRWQPGEYKNVNSPGQDIKNAIWERTIPAPSEVLFKLLGMLMEAAKDIASVNDAITGDAARTAPVGTTLALIEQGQQVFNAIYKRIYRALREEFKLLADCVRRHGDPAEYAKFCDVEPGAATPGVGALAQPGAPQEAMPGLIPQATPVPIDPAALFEADFNADDLDIRPVSDPSAVTKMQQMAKDQFALSFVGKGIFADDRAVVRQALLDAGLEQAEAWIPDQPPAPPAPNPLQIQQMALEAEAREAQIEAHRSTAEYNRARAGQIVKENTGEDGAAKTAKAVGEGDRALAEAATAAREAMTPLGAPEVVE